jgi:hypothetical protein
LLLDLTFFSALQNNQLSGPVIVAPNVSFAPLAWTWASSNASIVHCTKQIAELAKLDSIFVHCHRFNFYQLKRKHECK